MKLSSVRHNAYLLNITHQAFANIKGCRIVISNALNKIERICEKYINKNDHNFQQLL